MPEPGVVFLARRMLAGPPSRADDRRSRRGRSRLIGAMVGVSLSVIPLVVVQQVAEGMIAGITDRFIETGSYHLESIARTPPDEAESEAALAEIRTIPGVVGAVRERRGFGLVYSAAGRSGVTIRSVPADWWSGDRRIRELVELRAGEFRLSEGHHIVLGTEIADTLEATDGDEVRLLTTRSFEDGRVQARVSRFTVTGIATTGYRDLDRLWIFVPLDRGLSIVPSEGAQDIIGVKVEHPHALPNPLFGRGLQGVAQHGERLRMIETAVSVASVLDDGWRVYDWYSAERGRYVSFLTSRNLLTFVMAMIVVVAAVNISSALVLLVIEKEQDIAILRATGIGRRAIATIFLVAGLLIGFIGALVGAALGIAAAININALLRGVETAITFFAGRDVQIFNPDFYLQRIPVNLRFAPAAGSVLLVLVLSLFAALLPARRAAKVPPDRILRRQSAW